MELKNRAILVTGGTSGIGLELVQQLWERGNELAVLGRAQHKLDDLEKRFAGVKTYRCDLSNRQQVEAAMDEIAAAHPNLSVLINNAAVQLEPTFISEDFDYDGIGYEITTNLTAPLWIISLLLGGTLLSQSEALVVNVSSGLALAPKKASAVYCATKAALHSVSRSLRYQLEGTPVRVCEAIMPLVDTPMTEGRGRGKMSAQLAVECLISGAERGRDEVYIGITRALPLLMRLAPGLVGNMMKRA